MVSGRGTFFKIIFSLNAIYFDWISTPFTRATTSGIFKVVVEDCADAVSTPVKVRAQREKITRTQSLFFMISSRKVKGFFILEC
jgi:hypothetical protein